MTTNKYCIHNGYVCREDNEQFDDTPYKDEHQDEVYAYARQLYDINHYTNVVDFGCGSGYKLIKYFNYTYTFGFEIEPTLSFLIAKYPDKSWLNSKTDVLPFEPDMIICADVIEHIKNPDSVLQYFEYLKPKVIVISTPDRDLLLNYNGPPKNPAHVREWSYKEFSEYIGSFFKVKEHFISSVSQSTQVIVCKPKIDNTLKDMV